jgi:signal transduction histidine kinase
VKTPSFSSWYSLRLRLPLIMSALTAAVLTTFLWVAYRQVEGALGRAGGARAQSAADQLALMLTQMAQQRIADLQRAARSAPILAYMQDPNETTAAAARQRLLPLTLANQPPVELWDDRGTRLIAVAGTVTPGREDAPQPPPAAPPFAAGLSPFRGANGIMFWDAVADVRDDAAESSGRPARRFGYIVSRRLLSTAQATDVIGRLVGRGAVVELGNQSGDVWSNLTKVVPAPPVNVSKPGLAEYDAPDGEHRMGAASMIRGTPWSVWVEFPRSTVVAPARRFLTRMLIVGLLFVAAAAIVAAVISARITTPLHDLTDAAEKIAAGAPLARVHVTRRDEIGRLGAAFNTMAEQVHDVQRELEARVEERVAELNTVNEQLEKRVAELNSLSQELEAFSYSVSHDLRAPLRHITGFASMLDTSAGASLDEKGRRYLATITDAAKRMGRLIDDLLVFSRMGRTEMSRGRVDLGALVEDVRREVTADQNGRPVVWHIHSLPAVEGDASTLRMVLINLMANALKYSGTRATSEIEIGSRSAANETIVFVRDNGVGFDMQYAQKLFGVFQRLHRSDEFEGTGIGLANVRRIVHRHGGRVWAEAEVDKGATFFFSLPNPGVPPT